MIVAHKHKTQECSVKKGCVGHGKLCRQGWLRLYSYFVSASPIITSVAKSHCRQTARVAEGLPDMMSKSKAEFG